MDIVRSGGLPGFRLVNQNELALTWKFLFGKVFTFLKPFGSKVFDIVRDCSTVRISGQLLLEQAQVAHLERSHIQSLNLSALLAVRLSFKVYTP